MRIIAVTAIGWFIWQTLKQGGRKFYIVLLTMIAAGAAGNIIDSMFYGLVFNESSPFYVSYFVPFGTGYAPFLMGKVVDMLYFPIIDTTWPAWVPFVGGDHFIFFSPVFNFADSCITVGVILMLICCRRDLELMGETVRRGLHLKKKDDKKEDTKKEDKKKNSPKTGDETSAAAAALPAGVSLAAILAVLVKKFK